MQLKGRVSGYDDIATFELSDIIGSYKEDDVLYIRTSFGETPIIYSSIEPDRSEANDIALRTRASEEMGCTCHRLPDIIRKNEGPLTGL